MATSSDTVQRIDWEAEFRRAVERSRQHAPTHKGICDSRSCVRARALLALGEMVRDYRVLINNNPDALMKDVSGWPDDFAVIAALGVAEGEGEDD